ncbi:MAG: hypothetical protein FWC16_08670 [Defluviitaleaceae bacterium]|nr:hypothetical protein [Defluviitaleaceae bacterium]MCL2274984.1 hypothetical protein [Defluviitaleaceae bacterium]
MKLSKLRYLHPSQLTSYDFYANFTTLGVAHTHWSYIPRGLGMAHMQKILEGLGRATYMPKETLASLLHRAAKNGSTQGVILITAQEKQQAYTLVNQYKINHPIILCGGVD